MPNKAFCELDIWTEFIYNQGKFLKTSENLAVESGREQTVFKFAADTEVFCEEYQPNVKRYNEFTAFLKQTTDTTTPVVIRLSKDGILKSDQLTFKAPNT